VTGSPQAEQKRLPAAISAEHDGHWVEGLINRMAAYKDRRRKESKIRTAPCGLSPYRSQVSPIPRARTSSM
jgi:hypothetical protein